MLSFAMTLALANPTNCAIKPVDLPEGVISEIHAESHGDKAMGLLGSIAIVVNGTITAGKNECEGSAYKVSFEEEESLKGTIFTAHLSKDENIICPSFIDENWKGLAFEQMFRVRFDALTSDAIANIGAIGSSKDFGTLLKDSGDELGLSLDRLQKKD